jgi:hypothetical protein
MGIVGYADYDYRVVCDFSGMSSNLVQISPGPYSTYRSTILTFCSGMCSTSDKEQVKKLEHFAAALTTRGGGGTEAAKTGLYTIATQVKCEGKLFIIHLADQPPHEAAIVQSEQIKEAEILGNYFDWISLSEFLISAHPQVRYTSLVTHCAKHPFYPYLAKITGGCAYDLEGPVSPVNIRNQIARLFNGLFGLGDDIPKQCTLSEIPKFENEAELKQLIVETIETPTIPDRILATSLLRVLGRMKTDQEYTAFVISEFEEIITNDPMALTISPILGKMWRELCKRRSDPKRDELIELLQKRKRHLPYTERAILDDWLQKSYDSSAEIVASLKDFLREKEIHGLVRFLPEDDSFHAQQIIHLLAAGDSNSTAVIRAMLTRFYVDNEWKHPIADLYDEAELPLPERAIPLNLRDVDLFSLLMHTVAPGSKLTQRYAAMLALHAIQCGSILAARATDFLTRVKGKWISWKRRDDEERTPEIPENWSMPFLDLMLHPTCTEFFTPEELTNAAHFRKVGYSLRFFHQFEITVKVFDAECLDGKFPDHVVHCSKCDKKRPFTLMADCGDCGLCVSGGPETPSMESIDYIRVRCYVCGALYQRNGNAQIYGKSKCYNCRILLPPPPTSTCQKCNLKFVSFFKPEAGLPEGVCGSCKIGVEARRYSYKDYTTLVHQVFSEDHFKILARSLGLSFSDTFKKSTALYVALETVTEIEPEPLALPPAGILFRETLKVENVPEIWPFLLKIMSGTEKPVTPECALCFSTGLIVPACGRKGCSQRVCIDCSKSWYGKNIPGSLIYNRATLCLFCCRVPAPRILSRVDPRLISLASDISKKPLDPDSYYGWCNTCFLPSEVATRECAREAPEIHDYKCGNCKNPQKKEIPLVTKDCPQCTVTTLKISGCNHITCSSCSSDWCWECGKLCESSPATYDHMWKDHGRIFESDPYVEDEDDDLQ